MPRHRTILPLALSLFACGLAHGQTAPPPPPPTPPAADGSTRARVQVALERVAGEPKQVVHTTGGAILQERLRMRWPDLTVERVQLRKVRVALLHVRAMRRAIQVRGPKFWGAYVLIEQRGDTIVRLRGSRLKIDAKQTRRIRDAVWTGIAPQPHATTQRHVFVSNETGGRYYYSMEKRTPRRAGRFQNRLQHSLFNSVYVRLAKANHDALILAPSSVTSLYEQGEQTLVARRTLYPEVSIERRRVAPERVLRRLQTLEDGLDLPLIRTPSQVRKNQPPGRVSVGIDDQVAPASEK